MEQARNKYTTPIDGEPDIRQVGYIKAYDKTGRIYLVAKLTYELFWNEEYQYIFEPYWDLIEKIPQGVFLGITGLDMDRHCDKYYRVNMVPAFMVQRTPDRNRQDLQSMMSSVGIQGYDRFEYLLRVKLTCGNDNLIVDKEPTEGYLKQGYWFEKLQPDNIE